MVRAGVICHLPAAGALASSPIAATPLLSLLYTERVQVGAPAGG
jgi:hypothetical protein